MIMLYKLYDYFIKEKIETFNIMHNLNRKHR